MEQETIGLLVVGFVVVSGAYAVQLYLMGAFRNLAARRPFLWQFVWQTAAFVALLYFLYCYGSPQTEKGSVAHIENSFMICFCGLLWALSLLCLVHGIRAMLPQQAED